MKLNLSKLGIALFIGAVSLNACKKDEETTPTTTDPVAAITIDPDVIDAAVVNSGITVEDGEMKIGSPPAPNGNVTFEIKEAEQVAYKKTGFEIEFSSDQDIKGVYVQFAGDTQSYYDIKVQKDDGSNDNNNKISQKNSNSSFRVDDDKYSVEIDFTDLIQPGTFCYSYCVYTADGYVSQPSEVCVEVKDWGGNSTFTGTWILDHDASGDHKDDDGYDNDYEHFNGQCSNNGTINTPYDSATAGRLEFTLNSDATFSFTDEETFVKLDTTATLSSCSPVYQTATSTQSFTADGQWASDDDGGNFILIAFKFSDSEGNSQDLTDGELIISDASAAIESGRLVITMEEENETGTLETNKYYFDKK